MCSGVYRLLGATLNIKYFIQYYNIMITETIQSSKNGSTVKSIYNSYIVKLSMYSCKYGMFTT